MRNILALASACLIAFPCVAVAQGGPGATVSNTAGIWGVNSSGAPCLVAPVGATGAVTCSLPTSGGGGGGGGAVYGPTAVGSAVANPPVINGYQTAGGNVAVVTPSTPMPVASTASTTGGANVKSIQVANNTTSIAVCAAACTLYGVYVQNNSATILYLKLYNVAQASQTCGSGTPADRIMIPANTSGAGAVVPIAGGVGAAYVTALSACITAAYGDSDTTPPAANVAQVSLYTK